MVYLKSFLRLSIRYSWYPNHTNFFVQYHSFSKLKQTDFFIYQAKVRQNSSEYPLNIRKCKKASWYVQTYWAYAYIEVCLLHSGLMIFF